MAESDRGRDGSVVPEAPQMLHDVNASVKTPAVDRTESTETELEEENHASLLAGARAGSERTGDKLDPILGRPVDAPREPTGHFTSLRRGRCGWKGRRLMPPFPEWALETVLTGVLSAVCFVGGGQ